MSNLLINEPPLMVLPGLAKRIGLNEAIVLQQIHFWSLGRPADKDGHRWVYNTVKEWQAQFAFWSPKTVERVLLSLKHSGHLVSEKRGEHAFDQTLKYRVNYQRLNDGIEVANLTGSEIANLATSEIANLTESLDRENTERTQRKPMSESKAKKRGKHDYTEAFEEAWKLYPSTIGANKLDAFKAWEARLNEAGERETEELAMIGGTKAYAAYCKAERTEPKYVKHPKTFYGPAKHYLNDWTPRKGKQEVLIHVDEHWEQTQRERAAKGNHKSHDTTGGLF